ncbi:MAG TPA: hypothetical protein VHA82_06230 [Ramlibacter sp.]|uniref:hypothetical protein n=1 Tax=Ramlibacter sp. TaxID=1917967 RepID=UPI002CD86B06|nr:hypothetical protein [Ramlibacter sp.]HVZ43391.1 hypothetical protein [Ramlibacter sp.]
MSDIASHAMNRQDPRAMCFTVPDGDAARVRRALPAVSGCAIRSCVPQCSRKAVRLVIDFPPQAQAELMRVLLACVPSGEFGRVVAHDPLIH